jgi:hypothetical protein
MSALLIYAFVHIFSSAQSVVDKILGQTPQIPVPPSPHSNVRGTMMGCQSWDKVTCYNRRDFIGTVKVPKQLNLNHSKGRVSSTGLPFPKAEISG